MIRVEYSCALLGRNNIAAAQRLSLVDVVRTPFLPLRIYKNEIFNCSFDGTKTFFVLTKMFDSID